jgi:hypothetical protein
VLDADALGEALLELMRLRASRQPARAQHFTGGRDLALTDAWSVEWNRLGLGAQGWGLTRVGAAA